MVYRVTESGGHAELEETQSRSDIIPEPPKRKQLSMRTTKDAAWNGELITVESGGEELRWATTDIGKVIRMIYEMDDGDTVVINRTS